MQGQTRNVIPTKLEMLHDGEEQLREKALDIITDDRQLRLHLNIVEATMNLADIFRQFDSGDENVKVVQVLAMRTFNAFGASLKLAFSGYHQNGALVLRDVLETVFLLDLLGGDRPLIERWRLADRKTRMKDFSPVKVREALDTRDGFTSRRRAEAYELFSELAGHPTMKSTWMMRPQKEGDAVIGPYMEATALKATVSEMARLAVQTGEQINAFFPTNWGPGFPCRVIFAQLKREWLATFYSTAQDESR